MLIRKHGGELPIDDSASPIRDEHGRVSGCVLIFRDATAQRRDAHEKAEELLDARQLASIVESSGDAIIGKSLDGTIQSWNDAAERVFGYTAAEAVGHHISLIIPPDRLAEEDQDHRHPQGRGSGSIPSRPSASARTAGASWCPSPSRR